MSFFPGTRVELRRLTRGCITNGTVFTVGTGAKLRVCEGYNISLFVCRLRIKCFGLEVGILGVLKTFHPLIKVFIRLSQGTEGHVGVRISAIFSTLPVEKSADRFKLVGKLLFGKYLGTHLAIMNGGHGRGCIRVSDDFTLICNKPHEVFLTGHKVHFSSKFGNPEAMNHIFGTKVNTNRFRCWED